MKDGPNPPRKWERFWGLLLLFHGLTLGQIAQAENGTPPGSAKPSVDCLRWDAETKQQAVKAGEDEADFFFRATNVSEKTVTIERVQTSCGCTIAKLPSQPWVLKPKDTGQLGAVVNLRGKFGTLTKAVTVYFSDGSSKVLILKIMIPDTPEMRRLRNQQAAAMDRQLVFKDDNCARCHADTTRGKTGAELFAAACGICHESARRAKMVPDLHALPHSTDKVFWKQWITVGKAGTLMPAFAQEMGGPLDSKQIDSLVEYLWNTMPHNH